MTDRREGFDTRKQQVVSSLVEALDPKRRDKSPKGFIDAPILNLIHIINQHPDYYTTSSCSGRIAIYCEGLDPDSDKTTTKGGTWLYVSHDPVAIPSDADDAWIIQLLFGPEHDRVIVFDGEKQDQQKASDILNHRMQLIYFKFEPLILHVESASFEASMKLNGLAFQAGYQNSGITPSRTREMLAIRSTHKIDTPIAYIDPQTQKIHCLVNPSYLFLLLRMSNLKFTQNMERMKLFETIVQEQVDAKHAELATETKEQRKERKRREGLAKKAKATAAAEKQQDISEKSSLDEIGIADLHLDE
ncbi:methyltransferase TYW3-domain-containing protein [Dichotomocladium elegans]|nr:methyltransferase TYW3-domain-containing protein [Dichotomocladium elegans]